MRGDRFSVDEDLARVVDTVELQRAAAASLRAIDPRPLGRPLGEPRLPLEIRRRNLAGAREVVDDAAGHTRGQPPGRVPRLVHVPAPLVAEPASELPLAEELYHSSKFVSRPSTKVLISC